jgi:C1A family cysteine protease
MSTRALAGANGAAALTSDTHRLQHHYGGWRPSLPDFQDHLADFSGINVLPEVDPRAELPPAYDQGQLGSCTANATGAAIQYDAILSGKDDFGVPSRLDIYYGEREIEHSPLDQDTGAYGRDGFKWAHKTGVIPEADWPYDIAKFADKPPADDGHRHKIGAYKVVARSIDGFKSVLSNRQTVAIGFSVYESFESQEVATTGIMPLPTHGEKLLGGHEVLVVGYLKAEPNYALVRNSWGTDWGMSGYFLMPWAILMDPNMASDFRTIYRPAGK